jgi:hypothetical protein
MDKPSVDPLYMSVHYITVSQNIFMTVMPTKA